MRIERKWEDGAFKTFYSVFSLSDFSFIETFFLTPAAFYIQENVDLCIWMAYYIYIHLD